MITEEELKVSTRLEREIKVLSQATRLPTDEDIALQVDLIGCPQYCKGLGDTVTVNGVQVLKGGPFDTTERKKIAITWGLPGNAGKKQEDDSEQVARRESDLRLDLELAMSNSLVTHCSGENSRREKYGTPETGSTSTALAACAGCAQLKEELRAKCYDMNKNCTEVMERVKGESRNQLANLREEADVEIRQLRASLIGAERALAMSEARVLELQLKEGQSNANRDMAVDRASCSLAHMIERNSALAEALEHATASAARERSQCEFYRRTMKDDRVEMKDLQRQLGERQREEDERVEVYRESCRIARETVENLRKTTNEHETNEQETNNRTEGSEDTRDSPLVDRRGKRSRQRREAQRYLRGAKRAGQSATQMHRPRRLSTPPSGEVSPPSSGEHLGRMERRSTKRDRA